MDYLIRFRRVTLTHSDSSVNEVICHGIPDQRPLVEGDIVNIGQSSSFSPELSFNARFEDVSVYYDGAIFDRGPPFTSFNFVIGFHGDLNETYPVGTVDEASTRLMKAARDSMYAAIELCKPGALFRDIGKAM
jgi:methionyl aminopeptidase